MKRPIVAGVVLLASTVAFTPTGALAQVPGAPPAATPAAAGTVRGHVTEQGTSQPIAGAQVAIVLGTNRLGAVTDNAGAYVIRGVPAGSVSVRAQRIGYQPTTQTVTVGPAGDAEANFALARAVTQLEAVVTTATGEQSRREVGNVVATIRTDSIAGEAPVSSVTDVLQARIAGVQVLQGSGQTGASPSIRIRGTSSLSLTNEPLIIVDGVRVDNSAQPQGPSGASITTTRINRLGAFNPDDIESMDVIKGPSAAALYGTAAANGVIIITTKRGRPGRTAWNVYAEAGQVSQPADFFDNYRAWGRNVVGGTPAAAPVLCRISDQALGRCVRDSLTTFNPLMNADTRPFATQPRWLYGAQVSGGTQQFRYFLSAEREDETGPYQMPAAEIARLTEARGTRPTSEQIEPNGLQQTSLRGNFGVPLGRSADVTVSTGYSDRTLRTPFDGGFFAGLSFQTYFAPGFRTPTGGTSAQRIGDIFSVTQSLRDQRFLGSTALNWQPRDWLTTRATIGVDQNQGYGYRFARFGEGTVTGWGPAGPTGGKDVNRSNFTRYSVDLGSSATWAPSTDFTTRTSVGAQWFKDTQYQTLARGYSIPPGAQTPGGATQQLAQEQTAENATYGAFVEEVLGWRDRAFLTLGVRTDQNSAFGRDVGNTIYPRAALSYVLSDEAWFPKGVVTNVRLRSAFGQAGVQPTTIAALQFLTAFSVPVEGSQAAALRLQALGNASLKPEVTTEVEAGADIGFLDDRVTLEATFFNKESRDALFENPLPPSLGTSQTGGTGSVPTQWQNLAKVLNRGLEMAVSAQVMRTRPVTLDVRVNGSWLKNELVDAGDAQLAVTQGARNVVGYPLFGLWARPIVSYADADGDGVLTENEIVVGDTAVYKGSTLPSREVGLSGTLTLFGALRVSSLFDYRGGFYNQWGFENQRCISGNCRAVNDPTAPLDDQAAAVATTSARLGNTVWGFFEPNDFIRFRELSVSYDIPVGLVRRAGRIRNAQLVLSGRNIGVLWTRFPGIDPEANTTVANTGGGNNDFFATPPLRYWLLRLNLGL